MHELSVASALVDQVERIAAEHGSRRVTRIVVALGPLSGVDAHLLRTAYPVAAAGSVAESATLDVEESGVVVRCTVCGAESEASVNRLLCGACGDFRTRLVRGDEMLLARLELERTAAEPAEETSHV